MRNRLLHRNRRLHHSPLLRSRLLSRIRMTPRLTQPASRYRFSPTKGFGDILTHLLARSGSIGNWILSKTD